MAEASRPTQSVSVFRRRWQKFRTLRRGWYSFVVLLATYFTSFFLFLLVNNQAILVHYEGETYFPAFAALFEGRVYQAGCDKGKNNSAPRLLLVEVRLTDGTRRIKFLGQLADDVLFDCILKEIQRFPAGNHTLGYSSITFLSR